MMGSASGLSVAGAICWRPAAGHPVVKGAPRDRGGAWEGVGNRLVAAERLAAAVVLD